MAIRTTLFITTLSIFTAIGCGGNDKHADGPVENAGESADEAAEDTEDAVEEASEDTGEALESAGDDVEDATRDEE
jgi:hypothetical protein